MRSSANFCLTNLETSNSRQVMEYIEDHLDDILSVRVFHCLKQCERCVNGPFFKINGEIFEAKTPEELIKKAFE